MKPLPSRLESFWMGVIAGTLLVLALVPIPAASDIPPDPQIGGFILPNPALHDTNRHPTMRNDR